MTSNHIDTHKNLVISQEIKCLVGYEDMITDTVSGLLQCADNVEVTEKDILFNQMHTFG